MKRRRKEIITNTLAYSKYALFFLLLYNLQVFPLVSGNKYFQDLKTKASIFQLKADQLAYDANIIKKNLLKIKSNFAKKELKIILQNISNKQKETNTYPVDIYFSNKYKYNFDKKKSLRLPINLIVNILQKQISNAKTIRINKINFTTLGKKGSIVTSEFDNSFVDLKSYPEFFNLSKLKKFFLTSIIDNNKKQSLEWIWGKSTNNDAYFSTKLTLFKGTFSIYPIYRTYIGIDSFRNKNSWFFDLTTCTQNSYKNKNRLLYNLTRNEKDNTLLSSSAIIAKQPLSLKNENKIINYPNLLFNLDSIVKSSLNKQLDLLYYSKINGKHSLTSEGKKSLSEISDYLLKNKNKDFVIKSVNIKIPDLPISLSNLINLETIVLNNHNKQNYFKFKTPLLSALSEKQQIKFKKNIIRLYLLSAVKKNKTIERSSIEIIFNKKYKSQKYYATIATIFGDQITIFEDYSKIAPIADLKNKDSWLYKIPLKLEEGSSN